MYFTDRGIEELAERRGEEQVSVEWLADRLRAFVDLNPQFEDAVDRLPAACPGPRSTPTTPELAGLRPRPATWTPRGRRSIRVPWSARRPSAFVPDDGPNVLRQFRYRARSGT